MPNQTKAARRCRLYRDASSAKDFRLQPRHMRLLTLLYHARYATAEMLGMLYAAKTGVGSKRVRNDLGDLYHAGLVERWYYAQQSTGFGSEQYVYTLACRGARQILPEGLYRNCRSAIWHRSQRKAPSTIPHRLAITHLHMILALGSPDSPTLAAFFRDQESPLTTLSAVLPGESRANSVRPDAGAVLQWADGRRTLYLVEIDLTHRNHERLMRRYITYRESLSRQRGELCRRFNVEAVVALFVAHSPTHREHLRRIAQTVFDRVGRRQRPRVLFWSTDTWHRIETAHDPRYDTPRSRQAICRPQDVLDQCNVRTLENNLRPLFPAAPLSNSRHQR